jgi:hypothetical protein
MLQSLAAVSVCLSVCLHRHFPMLNLHTRSFSVTPVTIQLSIRYQTKHSQSLNCNLSINTELLNCSKCLSCRTVSLVCVAVQFCTAKHSPSADVYWREMGSTEGGGQTVCGVVSTGVLVLMRSAWEELLLMACVRTQNCVVCGG